MAEYGNKAQYVGSGSREYVFPGLSSQGGKLVVRANSPGEANQIVNFIKGLGGGQSNTQIINERAGGNILPFLGESQPPPQEMEYYESGGGYGGGGGGMAPPRQLASSPEWLAFLNALGLEEGQFRADIDRQRSFAKSAADQQIAQLGPQYDQQRRGITGSQEARGMARSGEHVKRLAESRGAQGRDTSNINLGLGMTLSGLESQLANKMMDLGARRASQELSLRAGGYV
jgi:hypothetical protein